MAKIISAYGGFTATEIKNRASNTSDMSVVGTTVECSYITTTKIKNILGGAATAIGAFCTNASVNQWSNFSPIKWDVSGNTFIKSIKTPYTFGSFAGYHHDAATPFVSGDITDFSIIESQQTEYITIGLHLGEIDWMQYHPVPAIASLNMEIKVNGSVENVIHETLSSTDYLNQLHTLEASINTSGWGLQTHTVACRFYLGRGSANSWEELMAIPTLNTITEYGSVTRKAYLRFFDIGDALLASLGAGSVIIQSAPDITNTYVTQNDAGTDTVTITCHGIDTNADRVGDLNLVQADRYAWTRLNDGDWYILNYIQMHVDDSASATFNLPWTVTYGDIVDVEIR
jgi:hypothetical protein